MLHTKTYDDLLYWRVLTETYVYYCTLHKYAKKEWYYVTIISYLQIDVCTSNIIIKYDMYIKKLFIELIYINSLYKNW